MGDAGEALGWIWENSERPRPAKGKGGGAKNKKQSRFPHHPPQARSISEIPQSQPRASSESPNLLGLLKRSLQMDSNRTQAPLNYPVLPDVGLRLARNSIDRRGCQRVILCTRSPCTFLFSLSLTLPEDLLLPEVPAERYRYFENFISKWLRPCHKQFSSM